MAARSTANVVAVDQVTQSIVLVRGQKVILDAELAGLYGVTTKRFNEQVRRNASRWIVPDHCPRPDRLAAQAAADFCQQLCQVSSIDRLAMAA